MIKLNYNLSQKKLECNYMRALFSTKFRKGKNAKSVKKKFDELKLKYPFDVIFFDISFVDIIFVKPENLRCLINKIELRIIEQSKIKHTEIKKKKTFIYDVKDESQLYPDHKTFGFAYASINELICLANLENINALLIADKVSQQDRLIKLNQIAIQQIRILSEVENRKYLK